MNNQSLSPMPGNREGYFGSVDLTKWVERNDFCIAGADEALVVDR